MRLEQFRYLEALARSKSMNAASQKLYVSPQAISLAMKQLESELNIQLLERSSQGVTLTPAGELVLSKSHLIINVLENLYSELDALRPIQAHLALTGTLTILTNPFFYALENLPEAVLHFRKNHPHITINLIEKESSETLHHLEETVYHDSSAVLGIINTIFFLEPFSNALIFYPMQQFGCYAYVAKDHLWLNTIKFPSKLC